MKISIIYYITRDSDAFGVLSDSVDVWRIKPIRMPLTIDAGHVWLPADGQELAGRTDIGHIAHYHVTMAAKKYGTIPDDDYQVIKLVVICE